MKGFKSIHAGTIILALHFMMSGGPVFRSIFHISLTMSKFLAFVAGAAFILFTIEDVMATKRMIEELEDCKEELDFITLDPEMRRKEVK